MKVKIIFFSWVVFFFALGSLWIFLDNRPPAWDQAYYLTGSEFLYQTIQEKGVFAFLSESTSILGRKAPLISYLPVPLFLVFGSSVKVALFVNLVLFVIFACFFFLFISKISDDLTALLSLVIISSMPLFYGLSRNFFVEFGLATIFICWLYFFFRDRDLVNKKNLLHLGITTGLGMLMKFHFFLFILVPIFSWLEILKEKNFSKIRNLLLYFLLPALVITTPWYSKNLLTVLWHAKRASDPQSLGLYYWGNPFSFEVIRRYFLEIVNYAISPYYVLIFMVLSILLIYKKKVLELNKLVFFIFLFPFLIFFFGTNKDYRLMLPVFPLMAYIFATAARTLIVKNYIYFLLFIFPVVVLINASAPLRFINGDLRVGPLLFLGNSIGPYVEKPIQNKFPNEKIVDTIYESNNRKASILISASEDRFLNINNLKYLVQLKKIPVEVRTVSYSLSDTNVEDELKKGDFVVIRKDVAERPSDINTINDKVSSLLNSGDWIIVKVFPFPDGGVAELYGKNQL